VQVSDSDEESEERRWDMDGKVSDARQGKSSAWSSTVSSISHPEEVRQMD
jgi:hypothetical protein